MKKYTKDGKVAVIYCPGYGAGWSTWNEGPQGVWAMHFAMDATIVEALLSKGQEAAKKVASDLFPDAYITEQELCIEWLPEGTQFQIHEYDGYESVLLFKDLGLMTA